MRRIGLGSAAGVSQHLGAPRLRRNIVALRCSSADAVSSRLVSLGVLCPAACSSVSPAVTWSNSAGMTSASSPSPCPNCPTRASSWASCPPQLVVPCQSLRLNEEILGHQETAREFGKSNLTKTSHEKLGNCRHCSTPTGAQMLKSVFWGRLGSYEKDSFYSQSQTRAR